MTDRTSVIRAVQTPLAFFTLVVLVSELILGGLAARASGLDFTLLVIGMLIILAALVFAVAQMAKNGTEIPIPQVKKHPKYDVFLSSVLAGFGDDSRLREEKELALSIASTLEKECRFSVYYAGRDVDSYQDFDHAHVGPQTDLDALRDSRHFLMLYPEKVLSSVIFEAGFALEHCESSTYLVHEPADLPYLMRRLPEVDRRVRTITFEQPAAIIRMIEKHREKLFTLSSETSATQ